MAPPASMLSVDLFNALTIAIRGGLITPQPEDEVALRKMAALPEMAETTKSYWAMQGSIRAPITLAPPPAAKPEADAGAVTPDADAADQSGADAAPEDAGLVDA